MLKVYGTVAILGIWIKVLILVEASTVAPYQPGANSQVTVLLLTLDGLLSRNNYAGASKSA